MEKQNIQPQQNIISTNINMNINTQKQIARENKQLLNEKKQLIHELLHKTSLEDLQMLVDYKKKMHTKPIPTPRKSVKQMTKEYEDNIIAPPDEFKDEYKPIPKPRKTVKQMTKEYEDNIIAPPDEFKDEYKPIPLKRTIIEKTAKALKGYTSSYIISKKHETDPLFQLQNTRLAVKHHIKKVLSAMKGIKFNETLKVTFWKPHDDGWIYKTAYFNSKPQTVINDINISEALEVTKQQILNFIAQWISEGSGWTIQSVDNHHINTVKYEPLKGSSYIQLPKELKNSAKGLINLKNNDNQCFRWCHIRHLNYQDKYPQRIKKSDKEYIDRLDYTGIEFPVTTKQYNKIEKQNEININVF